MGGGGSQVTGSQAPSSQLPSSVHWRLNARLKRITKFTPWGFEHLSVCDCPPFTS